MPNTSSNSSASQSSIALGMYIGNPDSATGSTFQTAYSNFVSTMGEAPSYNDVFIDYTQPISGWLVSSNYAAFANASTAATQNTTPVIALAMASSAAGALSADASYKAFASGAYDQMLTQMVAGWAAKGYMSQVWRPGWEMNLAGTINYAGGDAQTQADWVAAFQHIYTVLHAAAAADGVKMEVVWNPSTTSWQNMNTMSTLYPGNNYVDAIGADAYSDAYPYSLYDFASNGAKTNTTMAQWLSSSANQVQYWNFPASNQWSNAASSTNKLSLTDLLQFAQAQGKPFTVPEAGAGDSNTGADVKDDSAYAQWLASTLQTAQAGGENVQFVNLWDSNGGGNYEFSQASDGKPQEAAAWAKYFGAASNNSNSVAAGATASPAVTAVVAPPIVPPSVSAIAMTHTGVLLTAGQTAQITLTMSKSVTVAGVPSLLLSDGGTATYNASASTGTSLVFTYVPGAADTSTNLAVQSLSLNGGAINDLAGDALTATSLTGVTGASTGTAVIPASSLTFTDDRGKQLTQAVLGSGTQTTFAGTLDGYVAQNASSPVDWVWTGTFGQMVTTAQVADGTGRSFGLLDFRTANAALSGATNGSLTVCNASGGTISLANGNYNAVINAQASYGAGSAINSFNLALGSGTDTVSINAANTWGNTSGNITTTSGNHSITFLDPGQMSFTNGGGTDNLNVIGGFNQIHAGSGTLAVTESGGATDNYYFGDGNGNLNITGFAAGHDQMFISSDMKSSMMTAADGHGGTVLSFGAGNGSIDLLGVKSFATALIHWN